MTKGSRRMSGDIRRKFTDIRENVIGIKPVNAANPQDKLFYSRYWQTTPSSKSSSWTKIQHPFPGERIAMPIKFNDPLTTRRKRNKNPCPDLESRASLSFSDQPFDAPFVHIVLNDPGLRISVVLFGPYKNLGIPVMVPGVLGL